MLHMIFDVKAIEVKHVKEVCYLHSSILIFVNPVVHFVDVCLFSGMGLV